MLAIAIATGKNKILFGVLDQNETRFFTYVSQRPALATGKNTRLFGVLDQNEKRFFTYVSQRAESKAATVTISLGSFTAAGEFVLKLIRLESLGSELEES